jgi:hypothetical protein
MPEHDASLLLLLALGAVHGINPAMGWLFAVSLGLQEQRRSALWSALGSIALGHALAIAAALIVAAALGTVLPPIVLKALTVTALLGMGIAQLVRHRHPRLGGMRVGVRDLVLWSFLMASAHGAGLMVLPLVLDGTATAGHAAHDAAGHAGHLLAGVAPGHSGAVFATLVHTLGYLLVAALIAALVYEKLGLRLLRTAWINLNAVWAATLIIAAAATLML